MNIEELVAELIESPLATGLYLLDGHTPVVECDTLKWAKEFAKQDRRVAKARFGDIRVSTVFIGVDYQFNDGPPLLFETMIFGGEYDQECKRCSTWEQAETQHAVACEYFQ